MTNHERTSLVLERISMGLAQALKVLSRMLIDLERIFVQRVSSTKLLSRPTDVLRAMINVLSRLTNIPGRIAIVLSWSLSDRTRAVPAFKMAVPVLGSSIEVLGPSIEILSRTSRALACLMVFLSSLAKVLARLFATDSSSLVILSRLPVFLTRFMSILSRILFVFARFIIVLA